MKFEHDTSGKNKRYSRPLIFISLLIIGNLLLAASGHYFFSRPPETGSTPDSIRGQNRTNDSIYNTLVKTADGNYAAHNYKAALGDYEKALKIRSADPALAGKIAKIKSLISDENKAGENYQNAVTSADNYFKAKDYLNAKAAYQVALDSKPNDAYAKGKLQETMNLLRGQKASNILYDVAIASAEKLFQAKEYEKAMAEFENAARILPTDKYAKDRINECIRIMSDIQTKEEMYSKSIAAADKYYGVKNYQNALLEYKNANSYKPDEKYPQDKITELTALIAAQKVKDDAYNKAIASADKFFGDAVYPSSKTEYQNALKIKPDESYPKGRIREIDDILAGKKRTQEDFDRLITIADSLYIEKKYINAKADYQQALKIKPNEAYPKDMIAKADAKISGQEANAKATEEAYTASITAADKLFAEQTYDRARTEYQNALTIKPGEKYPQDKIGEIGNILANADKAKALDEQYNTAITSADQLLAQKSYTQAKEQYQAALKLKPAEIYPKEKITGIDQVLADLSKQKDLESQYTTAISKGDKLLAAKTWDQAKTEYAKASYLKPDEQYPKDKIAEIDKALGDLAQMKAQEEQYKAILAGADKLLLAKSWDPAKVEYNKALAQRPDDAYPKSKIAEIDKALALIADQQTKEEQYQASIIKADKLMADRSLDPAKAEYQNAAAIKPSETYPKTKIAEIDKIQADLAKRQATEEQYASIITNADKLLTEKSYAEAKTQYQAASVLKPLEEYPKGRIKEIETALADVAKQKALDDQYAASIVKADKLLAAKTYEQAKAEYGTAGTLKPMESYPKDKIAEIDKLLGDLAAQKALDDQYKGIIAGADKLLASKSYDPAKAEYNKALQVKPAEQYPKDKIAEIDKALALIAEQQTKEEQYQSSIVKADKLLADKSYDPAKAEYQNAAALKPTEAYPKTKIAEIDKVVADLAKQKALDDQYTTVITNADKLLTDKSYAAAKTQYQSASALKPAEEYPKGRIKEIDAAMADLAKQKALDDQYAASIAKADKLLAAKTYDQAKAEYGTAGTLKPMETYPKEKIAEIDKMLGEIAAQKALDEQYKTVIAGADKLLAEKSWDPAKIEYNKAIGLKPAEQYPKDKLAEIDKALALIAEQKSKEEQYQTAIGSGDKLLAAKSYDPAKAEYQKALAVKPAEAYPKTKIAEIDKALADIAKQKALDDEYAATIADADKQLLAKTYETAKAGYTKASGLKPTEQYPKDKIAEIDKALAELAKQKALNDQYTAVIAGADKLLLAKTYDQAKTEYTKASGLKPDEQYPKEKIAEIDKALAELAKQKALNDQYTAVIAGANKLLLAKTYDQAKTEYTKASGLKPEEQYPKDKIAEIEKTLADLAIAKELDEKYKASVAKADQLFTSKSWEQAKTEYTNASSLKPSEEYPKTKIAAIDKIFADLKSIDDQYNAAITAADQALAAKSYDQAREGYAAAGKIKPGEQYPKDKIVEVDKAKAEVVRLKSIDEKYKSSITKADGLLASKSYSLAKTEYTNAGTIKPSEQYPKDKITEIDGILAELKAKDDAYKASLAKADQLLIQKSYEEARTEYENAGSIKPDEQYPKNKITEVNNLLAQLKGKKATYDELVAKGDNLLGQKDYYKAKDNYQQAQGLFPAENYPKDRIARINSVIDSMYRANKGFYDKAIADGDKFFTSLIFDKAIDAYNEAAAFLPMEAYPREMIAKIKKTIAENAIVDVLSSAQVVTEGNDKQFPFTTITMASRKNNYIYIKIRNLSKKTFNVLVRYGKDKQPSGGAVIKNLAPDGVVYDRLISVRDQDPWYREDNNWISLYPQGGDIEVSFIQISRSQ